MGVTFCLVDHLHITYTTECNSIELKFLTHLQPWLASSVEKLQARRQFVAVRIRSIPGFSLVS
ncbi:hypothetical protein RGQ30_21110 [Limnobacter thiooxidans]|uniref:Uncharacterized protein n=1 Tax=Limnobacter thiooxidans TaxID=131080 RepID=A0AA86J8N0_9BURK|nr:hypothetical protein RGQ30_21110 [Limnobacter thiooxidans]